MATASEDLQAGVDGVVAVDDGHVHVGQAHGELTGFQLNDVQVLGVLRDVGLGGGDAGALLEGDEPPPAPAAAGRGASLVVSLGTAIWAPSARSAMEEVLPA